VISALRGVGKIRGSPLGDGVVLAVRLVINIYKYLLRYFNYIRFTRF